MRRIALSFALVGLALAAVPACRAQKTAPPAAAAKTPAPDPAVAAMPAGPGKNLTVTLCSQCHAITTVTSVRKSRADWTDTIQTMVGNGLDANPDDLLAVLDYLDKNYNVKKSPAAKSKSPAHPVR